ncbi:MAG: MATE family efflux transporter [Calditrichaeota bacterium]|nr:MAG: MATE family efflux transporter [Calditrichota bacterium]
MGLLIQRPLFHALGASEPVLALVTNYLTIIFLFAPLILLLMFTNSVFQGWGNTVFPMIFMLTGTISNLVLDPLLIFGLGPFPRLEMQGAALATGLGRVLALSIAVVVLFLYHKPTRVRFSGFQFDWNIVSGILKVGLPSSVSQILTTIAMSIIFLILKPYGPNAKAVYTIVFTYEVVVFLPAIGVSQAIIIMTGHNFGARLLDRVRRIYWSGTLIALGMMGTTSIIIFLFPHFFAGIFARSREVHQMATTALRISAVGFAFISFYLCSVASFQGLGLGRQYLLANMTRLYVLEAPLAFVGSHWLGLNGVWTGMAMGNIFSALLLVIWYLFIFRRQVVTGKVQAI